MRACAVFLQTAQNVFDIDHRIIDQLADRDCESAECHCVDGEPEKAEDQHRDQNGYRNGGKRHKRGAQVQQEDEQNHRHDDRCFQQHALHVVDRCLDERRLPELHVGRGNPRRKRALNSLERRLDGAGERHRIGCGLLLNADDDGRLAIMAGIAALDARSEIDGGDLLQEDRLVVADHDDRIGQVLQPLGQANVADQVFPPVLIDVAASGVGAKPRDGLLDLLVSDVERLHRRRLSASRGTGEPRRRSE